MLLDATYVKAWLGHRSPCAWSWSPRASSPRGREALGTDVTDSEDAVFWSGLLASLKAHRAFQSDLQRGRCHLLRNILVRVPEGRPTWSLHSSARPAPNGTPNGHGVSPVRSRPAWRRRLALSLRTPKTTSLPTSSSQGTTGAGLDSPIRMSGLTRSSNGESTSSASSRAKAPYSASSAQSSSSSTTGSRRQIAATPPPTVRPPSSQGAHHARTQGRLTCAT